MEIKLPSSGLLLIVLSLWRLIQLATGNFAYSAFNTLSLKFSPRTLLALFTATTLAIPGLRIRLSMVNLAAAAAVLPVLVRYQGPYIPSHTQNLHELETALSDLKAKRKGLRQSFTLNLKKIESELNKEIADGKELSVLRTLMDDEFQRLDNCQLLLSEELLKEENTADSYFLNILKKLKRIETCNEKCSKRTIKTDLTYLYDELEGKLRALDSLGRTQEKYRDFLIPLVESCLLELAWERSRNHESTQNTHSLEHLMNFLLKEVQGEEMVQLARTGFLDLNIISERTMLPLNV
ncbi:DUF1758 domain-containing protein [Trichonephila clavipes]|nr:DUF1758 domain-containing protein [Trichonephila clavipes]